MKAKEPEEFLCFCGAFINLLCLWCIYKSFVHIVCVVKHPCVVPATAVVKPACLKGCMEIGGGSFEEVVPDKYKAVFTWTDSLIWSSNKYFLSVYFIIVQVWSGTNNNPSKNILTTYYD
ncbi:unnamed protein product, partial [Cuscuta epithymum]